MPLERHAGVNKKCREKNASLNCKLGAASGLLSLAFKKSPRFSS